MKILHILLAIFLPPISVLIQKGISGALLLNILLTILGGLPGSIHAIYLLVSEKK